MCGFYDSCKAVQMNVLFSAPFAPHFILNPESFIYKNEILEDTSSAIHSD
jgi:hypothetical protein